MIKLYPTPVAVSLSHYKNGPLRQDKHRWGGSVTPKEALNTACLPYFSACKSLKQDLCIKEPQNFSFTPNSLILLCIWKHWTKWTASSITTHTRRVCEHMHTGEREEGRACISLLIRDGAGMLEKFPVKLHHEPG